jgi:SAM-dependent methyltransferase
MFESRAMSEDEFLDRPDCDPELAAASYRFMGTVNRWFGGIRTVRLFLDKEFVRHPPAGPVRILDIGAGAGDIPLALWRRAQSRGLDLRFTCLELSPTAIAAARARMEPAAAAAIQLLREDVFRHHPAVPYDYAVSSMCFHHFDEARILELVGRLRGFVGRALLINDLRRSPLAYAGAGLLLAGSHPGIRHDALLSIRRGFQPDELRRLLERVVGVSATVERTPWFRVAAVVRFKGENGL